MAYKVAFYTLLFFWIWCLNTLAARGTEPAWIAVFSVICGVISHAVYVRGWKPVTETNALTNLSGRLLQPTAVALLIFFATLALVHNHLSGSTRGLLVGAGFYFLSYWLLAPGIALRSVLGRQ